MLGKWLAGDESEPGSGSVLVDVFKVVIPSVLAAIVSILDPMARLLGDQPEAMRMVRMATPMVLIGFSVYVLVSKAKVEHSSVGFAAAAPSAALRFRYARAARLAALAATLPLSVWGVVSVRDNGPNALWGRREVRGYLCDLSGVPIPSAWVESLDDLNGVVSDRAVTDSNGYFSLRLHRMGPQPRFLDVRKQGCEPEKLPLQSGALSEACPRDALGTPQERVASRWMLSCK